MKYKNFKKTIALLLTCVLAIGAAQVPANACTTQYFAGSVAYNINNLGYQIMSSAQNTVLTLWVYHEAAWDFEEGGWNRITKTNGTRMTNIEVMGSSGHIAPRTFLRVEGASLNPNIFGQTGGFNANNQAVAVTANWNSARITMNSNVSVWGPTSEALATRQVRAAKTFMHEVGHTLKLNDVSSNCTAVMRQAHVSALFVVNHDRNTLRAKWG